MKSFYVEFAAKGKVVVKEEDVPEGSLGPMEVLLLSETSIISPGTELARLQGLDADVSYPYRPGYGCIGRVLAKGSGVQDFKEGDRVFYAGKHALVQRFQHGQNHQWGRLYPAPEDLDPVDSVFACMSQISMTAPNITDLDLGDSVAVFGLGAVGNFAAQLYRLRGARVLGLDPVRERCEAARKCGIEEVFDVPPQAQVEAVKKATGGAGAHVSVDAVGHVAVIQSAVAATRLHGQVVLLGSPRVSMTGDLLPVFKDIHQRGLLLRGAHMWRFEAVSLRNVKRTVPWALETNFQLIKEKKLKVRELATHVLDPKQAPEAYRILQDEKDKALGVVLDWRKAS